MRKRGENEPSRTDGERRHLTILFSDVVGSVSIAERLDPEEWHAVVSQYNEVAEAAVSRFGGYIGKFLGDGILAYFGWPHAVEHAAEGAVRAALAIVKEMAEVNKLAPGRGQPLLALRIGIHAGPVVVTQSGEIFGDAANIAARVQSEARPDTIFVTDTIRKAVAHQFALADEGLRTLKGVSAPLRLYRIADRKEPQLDAAPQSASAFVNRTAEIEMILSRWQLASVGHGQVVSIVGDAGMGKSRLISEVRNRISGQRFSWRQSAGAEFFQNTPFFAVAELFDRTFSIGSEKIRRTAMPRLRRVFHAAGMSDETVTAFEQMSDARIAANDAFVNHDLSSADDRHKDLVAFVVGLVLADAKRKPCILVLEDLHWLDHSTLACIDALRSRLENLPVMLILSSRPEFVPDWSHLPFETVMQLRPLDKRHVIQIVQNASADHHLADAVVDHIVARSDGIPLFAQELALSICEKQASSIEGDLPKSLADSLAARLDRLGPAREVAQIAAVIGSEFSQQLIGAVFEKQEHQIAHSLNALVNAGVLDLRGPFANAAYSFTHSLIKDAAYGTLLKSRRKTLHARVAQVMSSDFAELIAEKPEVVAHHWEAAEEWTPAAHAWQRVASAALSRAAFKETVEACDRCLSALANAPDSQQKIRDQLATQRRLVGVFQVTHGYSAPETIAAGARARELAVQVDEGPREMGRLISDWAAFSSAGNYTESSRLADRLLSLAKQDGRAEKLADAYMVQVTTQYRLANLELAERYFEEGRPYFSSPRFCSRLGAVAQTFGNASQIAWIIGDLEKARRCIDHALAVAKERNNPYDIAFSTHMGAMFALLSKEYTLAERLGAEAIRLSDEHHFPQFECIARIAFGKALVGLDRSREGVAHIEQGLAGMSKSGSRVAITLYLTWLAEAHGRAGDVTRASALIAEALSVNDQERVFRPESLRVRAELRASAGYGDQAIADLEEAIDMARRMRAKSFELRARIDLCRLSIGGERSRQHRQLADLVATFSSGFETADFKEAQKLLSG